MKHMNITGLSCIFPCADIQKTAEFYVNCLGFRSVAYLSSEEPHICLYRDATEIILLQANVERIIPNRQLYGYGYDAYLYTNAQEELEKEFASKGVKVVRSLHLTDYQNREFVIEDIDGRWLAFGLKQQDKTL